MTQQDLAEAVGVSLRSVGNWERGQTIPKSKLTLVQSVLRTRFVAMAEGLYEIQPLEPPAVPGLQGVETSGEEGRVVLYYRPGFFEGMSDDQQAEILAAGRLAVLKAAREIRDST